MKDRRCERSEHIWVGDAFMAVYNQHRKVANKSLAILQMQVKISINTEQLRP